MLLKFERKSEFIKLKTLNTNIKWKLKFKTFIYQIKFTN